MTEQAPTTEERVAKLQGLGCSRKRVEDARFTQGKGNYVDDIKMPGMVFGDFVRSPYGHARIKSIGKDAALALPGVIAVLTAEDLKPLNLHYMPTLAGDVQAVLADEKVLFQNQEVAFVVAEDRYIAADAVELVEVEYEELPVINIATKAMDADAPVLREDIKDKTEGAHGPRKHHNHIFTWEVGDAEATDKALGNAEVVAREMITYQRVHPCPLETCGCVASMDKINGKLTIWGTFQAPHAVRTVASLITSLSAISQFSRPCATNCSTSTSRGVSGSGVGGRSDGWDSSSRTLRAMTGWSEDSPRCTWRMACTSSSGRESFR